MFTPIDDLPAGAIGIEAHGRVTRIDRARVLEPRLGAALADGGRVRLLYVAGQDFAGYEEGGLFDDAVFGTRHFTAFQKIAFVAEEGPYDRAVAALEGLMPAALRTFPPHEIDAAKAWLAE
jgi:hypothetical protein